MNLHLDPISVGSSVHDLAKGNGYVTFIGAGLFTVQFGDLQIAYSKDGVAVNSNLPTLYWHPPVFINPPKDPSLWAKQKTVLSAVAAIITEI